MKKLLTIFALLSSLCLGLSVAEASPIRTYREEIPISKSIMLTKVEEFYSAHNISYSYIKADLTDKNTALELLTSAEGTDILDTVPKLTATKENVVAGLNADFFSTVTGGQALSLGIDLEGGKLSQSPIYPDTMATVYKTGDSVDMSYIDFKITISAPNGEAHEVRHLNKHTSYYGDILMYTSDLKGGMSPAPGGDVVEVVVSDGIVTEFRRNMPSCEIPKDGYVLVVSEGYNMFLANNFAVGDEIGLDIQMPQELYDADFAFGGGALVVSQGQKVSEYSHIISGYQPRSAIGIDQSGKTLYLVAVNGRQDSSRGMTMSELSDLMLSLGCYTAVNLDGGGSTNMQASTVWNGAMHKVNSPTENRKVINAVGLTYDNSDSENTPDGIMLENEKNVVLKGDSVKITSAVYDENLRPVSYEIKWTSNFGKVENGVFTPSKSGYATVFANAGKANTHTEFYVMDKVDGIEATRRISIAEGKTAELEISVFDNDGHYTKVKNGSLFEISSSDESVVSVSGKTLTARKAGTAIITIKKDNAVSYTSVVVAGENFPSAPENKYNIPTSTQAPDFAVGSLQTKTDNVLSLLINTHTEKELATAKSSAILGKNSSFSTKEDENALYITLDTSKGGIKKSDSTQWDMLISAINNTSRKNVFLLADDSLFGSSEIENKVIGDYLSELSKNVFVITKGEENSFKNMNGVKYFTLSDTDKDILDLDYLSGRMVLEFSFGTDVTFSWKKLY